MSKTTLKVFKVQGGSPKPGSGSKAQLEAVRKGAEFFTQLWTITSFTKTKAGAQFQVDVMKLLALIVKAIQRPLNPSECERLGSGLLSLGLVEPSPKAPQVDLTAVMAELAKITEKLDGKLADPEWVSVNEFAELTGVGIQRVRKWCRESKVNAFKMADSPDAEWRVQRKEAKRYKEEGFRRTVEQHRG
jgi:hypothetical protein